MPVFGIRRFSVGDIVLASRLGDIDDIVLEDVDFGRYSE